MKKSIKQRAVDFAGDRSQGAGHGYPSWEANLIERGYIKGAKDQTEIMYSEKEVLEHLNHLIMMSSSELDKFTDDEEKVTIKWFEQFKKK